MNALPDNSLKPTMPLRIRRESLHSQVASALGQRILRGDYAPGSLLPNEAELGAKLGVSRTALREAMKTLAAKGLVEARPKIGTRVRPREDWNMLDSDILAWLAASTSVYDFSCNLLQMREIFEPAAAALAASNRSPDMLAKIEAAFQDMADAIDPIAWSEADLRFHRAVLSATGNQLLGALGGTIAAALAVAFQYSARKAGNFKRSLGLHEAVLIAIRDGDAEAARKAAVDLLSDAGHTLERIKKTA